MTQNTQTAQVSEMDGWQVGEEGVLVSRAPDRGQTEWFLQVEPPLTNSSREPRTDGWCGTTNNVSVTAYGWHRVTEVLGWNKRGDMRIVRVVAA